MIIAKLIKSKEDMEYEHSYKTMHPYNEYMPDSLQTQKKLFNNTLLSYGGFNKQGYDTEIDPERQI